MFGANARGVNQSTMNEFKNSLSANKGDTPVVMAYKISLAAEMVRQHLTNMKDSGMIPEAAKIGYDKALKTLSAFPSTDYVLSKMSHNDMATAQGIYNKASSSLDIAQRDIQSGVGNSNITVTHW